MATLNFMTPGLLAKLAAFHGYEPAALHAVLAVETGGIGFSPVSGQILIQFEPVWFKRSLHAAKLVEINAAVAAHAAGKANPVQTALAAHWASVVKNGVEQQPGEYLAFNAATAIDPRAAMLGTSFGIGQIMGENYQVCGYASVEAMVSAFKQSVDNQFRGMVAFIAGKGPLHRALQAKDWTHVAYYYNGPGYAANNYDAKLKAAYLRYQG
jgi:hypothetical protein